MIDRSMATYSHPRSRVKPAGPIGLEFDTRSRSWESLGRCCAFHAVLTNGARRLMHDWLPHRVAEEYAMSSDWDDRWRTGGSVAELKKEAHIDPESIWQGLERFAAEREQRLARLRVE